MRTMTWAGRPESASVRNNVMASKIRTQIPRPQSRKRLGLTCGRCHLGHKGELERLAVRRSCGYEIPPGWGELPRHRTEKADQGSRARDYADGRRCISVERAMKKVKHVSTRTAWDDVAGRNLKGMSPGDRDHAMRCDGDCENMRIDQLYSKAHGSCTRRGVFRPAGWHSRSWGDRAKLYGLDAPTKIAPTDPHWGARRPTPQRLTSTR